MALETNMNMKEGFTIVVMGAIVFVLILATLTLPTWWLWNTLMPVIFGLPKISVFQSIGLLCLSGLLFKNSVTVKNNGQ